MPAPEKPYRHHVTVTLSWKQYAFLARVVQEGRAVSLSEAARSIIDRAMVEGSIV